MIKPALTRGFAATSHGQLHYWTCGSGPPLVLLQTIPFSAAIFKPLIQMLGDRFTCYAIDPMGYGMSDPRGEAWLVEDHAAALAEGLDDLGLTAVGLVTGHFTAMIGVALCLQRPDLVSRMSIDGVSAMPFADAQANLAKRGPVAGWTQDTTTIDHWWTTIYALFKKLDPELVIEEADKSLIAGYFCDHLKVNMGPSPWIASFSYDLNSQLPLVEQPVLLITSPTDTQKGHHQTNLAMLRNGREFVYETINPLYQLGKPERAQEYADMVIGFFG